MSFLEVFLFLAMVVGLVVFAGLLWLIVFALIETFKDIWYLGWRGWIRMRRA